MGKTFKQIRESTAGLIHQASALEIILSPQSIGSGDEPYYIPITKTIRNKLEEDIYGMHVTFSPESIPRMIKNQRKKRYDISVGVDMSVLWIASEIQYTIQPLDDSYTLSQYPIAVFLLKGKSSVITQGDLYSIPDKSGRRWFALGRVIPRGGVNDKIFTKYDKIFTKLYLKFRDRVSNQFDDEDLRQIFGDERKMPQGLRKIIQEYITSTERIFLKFIDDFREINASNFKDIIDAGINSTYTFKEAIITNYEIVETKIFLTDKWTDASLSGLDYLKRGLKAKSQLKSQSFPTTTVMVREEKDINEKVRPEIEGIISSMFKYNKGNY